MFRVQGARGESRQCSFKRAEPGQGRVSRFVSKAQCASLRGVSGQQEEVVGSDRVVRRVRCREWRSRCPSSRTRAPRRSAPTPICPIRHRLRIRVGRTYATHAMLQCTVHIRVPYMYSILSNLHNSTEYMYELEATGLYHSAVY